MRRILSGRWTRGIGAMPGVVLLTLCAPEARAQPALAEPGQLPAIDERTQAAIVDSVVAVLDTAYVMTDVAERLIGHLRGRWAEGAWRDLTDPAIFVRRLNEELHGIYDDRHLAVAAFPPADPKSGANDEDPEHDAAFRERLRRRNFGFEKIEILPGNTGYLELTQFVDTDVAGETAVGAMNVLANCDALIIDLRRNTGGHASMIQLLTGYLLPEHTHLINWYVRDTDETAQSWSQAYVPGRRIPDVPLYLLTGRRTGSAAEEFTFDLKNLERATVVGDTTAGAGNTVASYFFGFDGFRVGMRASYGAATDPRSGQGWEGVGVVPNVAVREEDALTVARVEIFRKRREKATDAEERFAIDWALRELESRLRPVTLPVEALKAYVGTYGPRKIFFKDDVLHYQREQQPAHRLDPMGEDVFRVGELAYFRLRFGRDESGRIDRVIGMYDDGGEDENARSE